MNIFLSSLVCAVDATESVARDATKQPIVAYKTACNVTFQIIIILQRTYLLLTLLDLPHCSHDCKVPWVAYYNKM